MYHIFAALAASTVAAAVPPPQTTQIIDTATTMAGQPLVVPSGPLQLVSTRTTLKAGAEIGTHLHLWARYVFVESGEVKLKLVGEGLTQTFKAGEMIVEPIGKWHSGQATADTVLLSVEQVPPGRCNTIRPPAGDKAGDC